VTANVVDIEADAQTVLHAAAVQDIGGGMYQVWLAFTNESWTLSIGPIRDGGNLRDLALLSMVVSMNEARDAMPLCLAVHSL